MTRRVRHKWKYGTQTVTVCGLRAVLWESVTSNDDEVTCRACQRRRKG